MSGGGHWNDAMEDEFVEMMLCEMFNETTPWEKIFNGMMSWEKMVDETRPTGPKR